MQLAAQSVRQSTACVEGCQRLSEFTGAHVLVLVRSFRLCDKETALGLHRGRMCMSTTWASEVCGMDNRPRYSSFKPS